MTHFISIVLSFSLAVGGNSRKLIDDSQESKHIPIHESTTLWWQYEHPVAFYSPSLQTLWDIGAGIVKAAYCLFHWRTRGILFEISLSSGITGSECF